MYNNLKKNCKLEIMMIKYISKSYNKVFNYFLYVNNLNLY